MEKSLSRRVYEKLYQKNINKNTEREGYVKTKIMQDEKNNSKDGT